MIKPSLQSDSGIKNASPAPGGHHARRTLAVRALAAQVDWLVNGVPHWSGDRIAWRVGNSADGTDKFPDVSDLAQARRIVAKTRQYPFASIAVFADPDTWRTEMLRRITLAGRLRLLRATSTATQLQHSENLIALLPAQALCVFGAVPGPPSGSLLALCAAGGIAASRFDALAAMADDAALPAPARALAALVLGAMLRTRQRVQSGASPFPVCPVSPFLRPAFERGLRGPLPLDAALFAALFACGGEHGQQMAERGERLCAADAQNALSPFPLPIALLRESALRGAIGDTESLLGAAEMLLSRGADLSRRLTGWRHEITPAGADKKDRRQNAHLRCRTDAERLRISRTESVGRVAKAFEQVLRDSLRGSDGCTLVTLTTEILRFGEMLLTLSPASWFVLATMQEALEACLRLPTNRRADFLALAVEQRDTIWHLTLAAKRVQTEANGSALGGLLWNDWLQKSGKLRALLQTTGDPDLIREAIGHGIYEKAVLLVTDEGGDADHLRLFVRLARLFRPDPPTRKHCRFLGGVRRVLRTFPSGREARDALQPLLSTLLPAARDPERLSSARHVLTMLLREAPGSRDDCRRVLARLPAVCVPLLRWTERASETIRDSYSGTLAEIAVWLATQQPDNIAAYFAVVLENAPTDRTESEDSPPRTLSLLGVQLAAALAGNDAKRFAAHLAFAVAQTREDDAYHYQDWLREGIQLLDRFPGVAVPLRERFLSHPRRCLALLRQIGRATHLGVEVLAPLDECGFDSGASATSDDTDWQAVLALVPDRMPVAADLWQAQWLRGQPANVPPGICRLMGEHARRGGELTYLEALCETKTPESAFGLFARRDSLRERLRTDRFGDQSVIDEIRDRLHAAAMEARLAHAEQQAALCYRARLRQTVGPLPARFALTPDIENATLLSFTITANRKLLAKLLRARVRGDADPFENHPSNVAFRERLAASGVCVTSWRGAAPRRVGLPTRTIHLALETDPLHVLQMGNYFGTCLSAGSGCNAFSTVANAIEQNKRVLFVRDGSGSGRVIARKLIGITGDGNLVGFETYCRLEENEGAADVRAAVRDYLTDFAARCRLPLADTGEVPTLFAESWYDDGTVAWTEEAEERSGPLAPVNGGIGIPESATPFFCFPRKAGARGPLLSSASPAGGG